MGELAALATAFLWAFTGLLMRPAAAVLPAIRITALEYLVAATAFVAILLATDRLPLLLALPMPIVGGLAFSAVFGLAAGDTAYIRSLSRLGLGRAFTLSTAGYFVVTVGVSALVLGEGLTPLRLFGAAIMLAGISLIAREDEPTPAAGSDSTSAITIAGTSLRVGLAFALLAAVCWGLNTVALRVLLENVDVLVALPLRLTAAAIALNAMSFVRTGPLWVGNERSAVVRIVAAGLLGLGLGSVFYLYAIQTAGAAKTAILSSASPLFAAAFGVLFLKESLTRALAVGTLLVVIGMALVAV